MFNRIICYFMGHPTDYSNPYSTFIDTDGLMKVLIKGSYFCSRCDKEISRPTEPHERESLRKGKAVIIK